MVCPLSFASCASPAAEIVAIVAGHTVTRVNPFGAHLTAFRREKAAGSIRGRATIASLMVVDRSNAPRAVGRNDSHRRAWLNALVR
jgi:hypothetical protein